MGIRVLENDVSKFNLLNELCALLKRAEFALKLLQIIVIRVT